MLVLRDSKGGGYMVKRNFIPEQIINKLREAEIHINQGVSVADRIQQVL